MNYNLNETGQTVRINMDQDISTATAYTVILEPKHGEKLERTGTLGTVNVNDGDDTYLANEYIEYVIADGDLTYAGQWRKKGQAVLSATNTLISDYEFITVLE